jgi:uncharacterized protein YjbI with pentapeptide repeats
MDNDFTARADTKRNEYLLLTEELFTANITGWFAGFASHFRDVCAQIRQQQECSELPPISFLEYNMLYSNFINRNYTADIFAYGEKTYFDKAQRYIRSFDISFMFVYFDKLWDNLISLKKHYIGKVSAHEVTAYMLRALPSFYSYLKSIARFAIMDCADEKAFQDVEKNEFFKVRVGGYMAKPETVFAARKNKDVDELVNWFGLYLWGTYTFGDYSGLDFAGKSFLYADFRFARFQDSTFRHTNFDGSSLTGANFRGADMEGCRFDYCSLYQTDFTGATLKNASFRKARGNAGLTDKNEWKFVGFLPISFRNADLTNADFTGADIKGADFTQSVMDGAKFDSSRQNELNLSQEQIRSVVFV